MKRKVIQRPPSARQKMINLMYIVLLAMLAMNISSDVLNGFTIVEESLSKSTTNASLQNEAAYREFAVADSVNHEKVGEWYAKALYVKQISDSLFNFADELKTLIAIEADGKDADVEDIHNREDLEAATQVTASCNRRWRNGWHRGTRRCSRNRATGSVRAAGRMTRCGKGRDTWRRAFRSWWTSTWKSSSTG